jgi:hypothetical protein
LLSCSLGTTTATKYALKSRTIPAALANFWLLSIEQRISSVGKETFELKRSGDDLERSNKELSRKL